MVINRSTAMKLWKDIFGEETMWAVDCFGSWIHKEDFGDYEKKRKRPGNDGKEYRYGWSVDHIMPIAKGGKDMWNNFEPMHYLHNEAKGGEISFKVNTIPYQVVKCNLSNGYGIKNQTTGERVDWKFKQQRWYV